MIAAALYNTVNPILEAFPLEAVAEQTEDGKLVSIDPPFAIYSESYSPFRTKDSIAYYTGTLFVAVVAKEKMEVLNYSTQIITAVEALAGTTINDTFFRYVRQASDLAVDYDPDDQVYYSELTFNFKSKNE